MLVEIGAEGGDVLCGADCRQKAEIGVRRPDSLDPRQLLREPRGDRRQMRFEGWVGGNLTPLGGAGDLAHDEKRLGHDAWVGAGPERLGHRDPSGEHRFQDREFLYAPEARRDPGRCVGAQH